MTSERTETRSLFLDFEFQNSRHTKDLGIVGKFGWKPRMDSAVLRQDWHPWVGR